MFGVILALLLSDPENPDRASFYLESEQDAICVVSDAENPGVVVFQFVENVMDCPEGTIGVVVKGEES